MNVVVLRVIHREPCSDFGLVRLAIPSLSPDDRWIVFEGTPPATTVAHPNLASVGPIGEIDGRTVYVEQVPSGVRLADAAVPSELLSYVVASVLDGIGGLHESRLVHGAVGASRIVLGGNGEVVLIGRGRRSGTASNDIRQALALLPSSGEQPTLGDAPQNVADRVRRRCRPGDRQQLGDWVRRCTEPSGSLEQVLFSIAGLADGMDEVVPDLGPDIAGDGILDRWGSTTSHTGETTMRHETTPEITDGTASQADRLAFAMWNQLSVPPARRAPDDRFGAVQGVPSLGIRAVLADEAPDIVSVGLVGDVPVLPPGRGLGVRDPPTEVPLTAVGLRRFRPGMRWIELTLAMILGGAIVALLFLLLLLP